MVKNRECTKIVACAVVTGEFPSPAPMKLKHELLTRFVGKMELNRILKLVTEEFEETPYDINNGCCEEWAERVLEILDQEKSGIFSDFGRWDTVPGLADTNHVFIFVDGKFYDAECLEGVVDYMELPIFKKLNRDQPVVYSDGNYLPEIDRYHVTDDDLVKAGFTLKKHCPR